MKAKIGVRADRSIFSVVMINHGVTEMDIMNIGAPSQLPSAARLNSAAGSNEIVFSVGESALGKVLVARSDGGVCAVLFGSDSDELSNDLATRFPDSRLVTSEKQLRDVLSKVLRFIDKPSEGLDLPLDMRHGTPFQRRVWDALLAIPCGSRVTYAALAHRIGMPNAARAVASACAANAIALGIPCHRVVRSDGTLSGYRWGLERKRALLNRETVT